MCTVGIKHMAVSVGRHAVGDMEHGEPALSFFVWLFESVACIVSGHLGRHFLLDAQQQH